MRYFVRMRKSKTTDSFIATDEHGEKYPITEVTYYVKNAGWGGTESWEEAYKKLSLDDGSAVNRISDTIFEIVSSGVRLTRESE